MSFVKLSGSLPWDLGLAQCESSVVNGDGCFEAAPWLPHASAPDWMERLRLRQSPAPGGTSPTTSFQLSIRGH